MDLKITLVLTVIIYSVAIWVILQARHNQIQRIAKSFDSMKSQRDSLFEQVAKVTDQSSKQNRRIRDLEDALKQGYGISARVDKTEIVCDFDKLEMVIIISGVNLLLSRAKNPDDTRVYLALVDKINKILPEMKE